MGSQSSSQPWRDMWQALRETCGRLTGWQSISRYWQVAPYRLRDTWLSTTDVVDSTSRWSNYMMTSGRYGPIIIKHLSHN
jgi:hypothetical protein